MKVGTSSDVLAQSQDPTGVKPGDTFSVPLTAHNRGLEAADGFRLDLVASPGLKLVKDPACTYATTGEGEDHTTCTYKEERPAQDVAARLGGPRRVLAPRRRYLLDGRPVEFATSCLPLDIARGTPIADPKPGPGGIYARLEELGHRLDHFDEEIRARMPAPAEVKLLRLATGVPVIHLIRTAYDTESRPVEVCDTVMAADAYVLAYQLPAT
ncbi:UTRA domain-containing protein [Streptomyces sp. NPDC008139]|uniref:GntR family transcriptional regulator n=1 Tax=Streptomyces sp. NPDC008139 TaxID=3364814 RepID=UPI0036E41DFF